MPAPRVIADLVERFEQQDDAYKSGQYNEAQLRKEFVDPMFKALGWDMDSLSRIVSTKRIMDRGCENSSVGTTC